MSNIRRKVVRPNRTLEVQSLELPDIRLGRLFKADYVLRVIKVKFEFISDFFYPLVGNFGFDLFLDLILSHSRK